MDNYIFLFINNFIYLGSIVIIDGGVDRDI